MTGLLLILLQVVLTGLAGVITAVVVYARWHYGTLEKVKGLPVVVKPAFVGGSDLNVHKKVVHEQDTANVKKHGKLFGIYEGRQAHIYVADPEMVRLIFIKDFDHFHNKRIQDFGHELINEMMDILPYEKWRVVRTFISPTLTTGKIRGMALSMCEAIEQWIGTVKEKHGDSESFMPRRMYSALTSDIIARCGFGVRVNSLLDPDNIFVKHLKVLAGEDNDVNFLLPVAQTLPLLTRLAPFIPGDTLEFFSGFLQNAMKARKGSKTKINDFVETLNEMMDKLETEEYKKHKITETTVMNQALIFFLAGFETTASTMSFLTYNLATNPDKQEKLIAEVDAYLARHQGKVEHETVGELVYLHACVQETLRMFPPVIRVERVCNKDWYHEPTGLHIPKGVVVQVPIYAIHYNEEYYPNAKKFEPERFLPENKDKLNPYAFISFGMGNHNCVGMRFAKEEMYLAMATVMRNFRFKANETTKIKFQPGKNFIIAVEPYSVDAIRRD